MKKTDDVFDIDELAAYLKIPKSTVYKLVREGKIPAQKVGRHWRFHREAIVYWLGNRKGALKP
jgi:excisionase family DNA binding protein